MTDPPTTGSRLFESRGVITGWADICVQGLMDNTFYAAVSVKPFPPPTVNSQCSLNLVRFHAIHKHTAHFKSHILCYCRALWYGYMNNSSNGCYRLVCASSGLPFRWQFLRPHILTVEPAPAMYDNSTVFPTNAILFSKGLYIVHIKSLLLKESSNSYIVLVGLLILSCKQALVTSQW